MTPPPWFAAAAFLVGFALTGCNNPSAKLLGKWQFNASAGGGNPVLAMLASTVKGEHEFKTDGTFSMTAKSPLGDKTISGTWRFVKAEGQALVLMTKSADSPENEIRLEFTDNDHFSTVPFEANEATKDLKLDFARLK
jgi:hypothetical protein